MMMPQSMWDALGEMVKREEARAAALGLEVDKQRAEIERLRAGLLECATIAGADTTDGIPTWPDIVTWATGEVRELREDYGRQSE